MIRFILVVLVAVLCMGSSPVSAGPFPRLNPYAPHNAVAAEPPTPYNNLDFIPRLSRVDYPPCPDCGTRTYGLPDFPHISQPVKGPFQKPVPVP